MMECPVTIAIKDIYGSGWVDDTEHIIRIGGSDSVVSFVCDEAVYYMMTRKMEFARFELSKPDLSACKVKNDKMFGHLSGLKYSDAYIILMDLIMKKKYLYDQFTQLIELLNEIEQTISAKISYLARIGYSQLNISIPDIFLLPGIDKIIIYRPDLATYTINKIIDYVNSFNINAILRRPIKSKITHIGGFNLILADGVIPRVVSHAISNNSEEYIANMKKTLEHEFVIVDYIKNVENYHCTIINHMNKIYDWCKHILSNL